MKKYLLLVSLILSTNAYAQTPSLQDKLYYTCKVWGFVKYYHSEVSVCHVNWDSVLLSVLPAVRAAGTSSAFNDVLDTMLAAAGPMAISSAYFPDTIAPELKRNRDFSWFSALRSDVRTQLDTIKNNFRPHAGCWAMDNDYTSTYYGWLVLPHDSIELNVNTTIAYPDADHRLLMLMKYWNVVRYFYPYNYVLDTPWDTTFRNYVLKIDTVSNAASLYYLCLNITTALNDVHVYGLTRSAVLNLPPGNMQPPIRLQYMDGKYVVVRSSVAGIYPGDAVISKDGITATQWEDSLKHYYSSGNASVLRRSVYAKLLGTNNSTETLVVEDSTGTTHTITVSCPVYGYTNYNTFFYPNDSLSSIKWNIMGCNTGYVNMGNLLQTEVNDMYADLAGTNSIIFDLRNYPNATAWPIANLLYAGRKEHSMYIAPDITYPGTFTLHHDTLGIDGNPTPYMGKVIILMNEQTQSQAEFSCMILEGMPDVVKIGSQTAGADGNISQWKLSQDITTGFTTLGEFYPNGDSTQRIGIVPDSVVYPTRAGIRAKNDEVLNKALQVACTTAATPGIAPTNSTIKVYPNPAHDIITVGVNKLDEDRVDILVSDITGQQLLHKKAVNNSCTSIDITKIPPGLYFVTVKTATKQYVTKIVKE